MKILPIIAAANSAFGKSVTATTHLLSFWALYIVILSFLGEIFDFRNFGWTPFYKVAIEFSMLPTNCCFW